MEAFVARHGIADGMLEGSHDLEDAILAALHETAAAHRGRKIEPWEVPMAVVAVLEPWTEEAGARMLVS